MWAGRNGWKAWGKRGGELPQEPGVHRDVGEAIPQHCGGRQLFLKYFFVWGGSVACCIVGVEVR